MSSCTFNGRGSFKGTATQSADTRPNFEVTGTVGSGAYILSNNFNGFNKFNLTSSANIQECVFTNPNQMTQSGATINGCTFEGPTVSASVAFLRANNLDLITNCSFNGTSSFGHAIQITTAATYSFDGNTFSGYSGTPGANLTPNSGDQNAEIYNNSGGYVYINISNGDTPSVRNGVGASTELSNPVLLTLTGILSGSEVTITSGSDSTVLYHLESVTGTGQAIYQYNYSAGTIVDILIFEVTKDPNLSNIYDYTLGSINSTIPIRQIPDRVYTNPLGS